MKRLHYILLSLLVWVMTGCDATIHEYPGSSDIDRPIIASATINLEFNTDMPVMTQTITKKTRSGNTEEDFDLRYIINIYRNTESRQIDSEEIVDQIILSKDDISSWDISTDCKLEIGCYDIVVWADYVDAGTTSHKYYIADNLQFINLIQGAPGSTDFRDGFVGQVRGVEIGTISADNVVTIPMTRPMAKYKFISNDLETFLSRMLAVKMKELMDSRGDEEEDDDTKGDTKVTVDINDYYVEFSYPSYVNTTYNVLLDIPAAPTAGNVRSFTSEIKQLNNTEAELGFDYIFTNGTTQLYVSLKVFDKKNNTEVANIPSLFIDLQRSKLTEVRGSFLTTQESGGVGISPGFDDEYTWDITDFI